MYRAIARNKRNTVLILVLFLAIIGGLGALASAVYRSAAVVVVVLVVAAAYALFQYFFAAGQAVALSGGVSVEKADEPRLYRIVENLSIATGTPMPKVYLIDDPAPNAFATGRDPEHAVVAATTGLLAIMDDAELEGVMAHELGHVRNYDIRVSMIVFGLVVAVGFLSDAFLRLAFVGRGGTNNGGGNPALLIVGLVSMVLAPIVATAVQLSISRQREYLADATSALTTRHPDALARALLKLESAGRPMQRQNSSMAHLWIADPSKPGVVARLFATHPPIADRVARLSEMGSRF
ncbi:protease [Rathayibacter rathayi]|uniref:Protease HtpX homolog n=1 Tax=Rathayibacter rathayi TaxID=33887 RepID=A0ABD6WCJ2_RATRA|nr:M48 family metallopeptidase [Rathayibacter rathayi]AZZ49279.1 protease [Rathayibacter rathayi]MWV73357.1 M48 family metalloprotease [Rathayibacter rathayi NCPPB 2980 = VKM Ac-1601]PPF16426.1 protease [Rathayibacter rathayi]PPF52017.1 protease [Rathayibacter rathayi]PPF83624.1 protease [Rathayibacter rathayi]